MKDKCGMWWLTKIFLLLKKIFLGSGILGSSKNLDSAHALRWFCKKEDWTVYLVSFAKNVTSDYDELGDNCITTIHKSPDNV